MNMWDAVGIGTMGGTGTVSALLQHHFGSVEFGCHSARGWCCSELLEVVSALSEVGAGDVIVRLLRLAS